MCKKIPLLLLIILLIFGGCAVPLKNTTLLEPNMTKENVQNVLESPYSTSFHNGYHIWDYHLQYYLNSGYPYRLIFDKEGYLVWWGYNNEEAKRITEALKTLKGTDALPFKVKIDVQ